MNDLESKPSRISVKDLKAGDTVMQFFELRSKEARKTRSGDDYLDLAVGDATGTIPGKMWPEAIRKWGQDFRPGDFVKVVGRVERYRDKNQLVVDKIRIVAPSEVPGIEDLVRSPHEAPDALFEGLRNAALGLQPPELASLVVKILDENNEQFKTHPAARMVHHAYKGGLIEHVAAVTRKVGAIAALESAINRDVAVAGAILHDIGKLQELDPRRGGRTTQGRLVGHLVLGVELIRQAAVQMNIDDRPWLRELEHIVISHHGGPQFGSPVRPMTREAVLVHFIDNLDAKLKIMDEALETTESDGFSAYNRWLEGRAFSGSASFPKEDEDAGT